MKNQNYKVRVEYNGTHTLYFKKADTNSENLYNVYVDGFVWIEMMTADDIQDIIFNENNINRKVAIDDVIRYQKEFADCTPDIDVTQFEWVEVGGEGEVTNLAQSSEVITAQATEVVLTDVAQIKLLIIAELSKPQCDYKRVAELTKQAEKAENNN